MNMPFVNITKISLIAYALLALTSRGSDLTVDPATLQGIAVQPASLSIELGAVPQKLAATGRYSDGTTKDLTSSVRWTSSNEQIAAVDSGGDVTAKGVGDATIRVASGAITATTGLTVRPPGHFLMRRAGLFTQFEERGYPNGYYSGTVIQNWSQFDPVVGSTVAKEVSLQLDKMKAMGVNTITFQLRTSDPTYTGTFVPPSCNEPPDLGLQFPQPTATELANLPLFFDMVESKGMKVWLSLINTHMEEQPPTNAQTWIGAILGAIGKHPALDVVTFDGTTKTVTNGSGQTVCALPGEAPLWLGPGSIPATYVQWAISFAISKGLPARKAIAESIIGSFFLESQPAGGGMDGHLWSPIAVMKGIFDDLGIDPSERTYGLSFYEHRKCFDAQSLPCTDLDPHDWADQTLAYVTSVTGFRARLAASEMGDNTPVDQVNWPTQYALESLTFLLHKYHVEGGAFWRWTSFEDSEDSDPTLATPVKVRGVAFIYNPVEKEVVNMGGFHLPRVPNGLFERSKVNGVPADWTATGNGTVTAYSLVPVVPSRGTHAMQLVTGAGSKADITASSARIPVGSATAYETTANMQFAWTGDPAVGTSPSPSRPQVFMTVLYFRASGAPSAVRAYDSLAYFQEDSTSGFATFPMQYTTPSDAAFVQLQFGASRNGLPSPITLDVQNVR
jgi:Bacterial Ig-like domain (group 2)